MKSLLQKRWIKITALIASMFVFVSLTAGSCDDEGAARTEQAQQSASQKSLEKDNLNKKRALEENPDRVGYITLLAGVSGKPFGYYTVKGKISNSGSQIDPEDLIVCRYTDSCTAVDGPQDDGTYGGGDPGVFFFTTDGTYVEFTGDYVYSTQPLPSAIDVPKLG